MVYEQVLFEIIFYNNVFNFKSTEKQVMLYHDAKQEKLPIAFAFYYHVFINSLSCMTV